MDSKFDIIIIGAGPAGLSAARQILALKSGSAVLLADKSTPWKEAIPCAEGVFCPQFHEIINPDKSWIRFLVDKAVFHSPSGATITYQDKNKGYIINRAIMQKDLADQCAQGGIECRFSSRAVSVGRRGKDGLRHVAFDNGAEASARVVIDCSGPLSTFGRDEPIHAKAVDLEVAYMAYVRTDSVQTDTVHLYAGKNIAPGGYAWAFPRTKQVVNAGIIIGSAFRSKVNIRDLFSDFISTNFQGATVEKSFAGTIPCTYGRKTLAISGLIKAGDAASTVNPVSRAGISEAMMSGALAGKSACAMLDALSEKALNDVCKKYTDEWYDKRGKHYTKLAKVKNSLAKVPDSDYNKSAQSLSSIPLNKLTMSKIFAVSLARFPRLVWALRHVL